MGTATITSDNKILYKPNPDRNGRDSFSYTVTDSDGESSTATVHLAVAKVNDGPPVARADRYSVAKGKTLRVAAPGVLKNDADPDGDALSATVLRKPGKGTLSLGGKGGFSYKAPANYTGKVTFAYRALDGMGGSDSATVTLYVKQPAG